MLLASVEGTAAEPWPASPPFQQAHLESRPGGRQVVLLVGMAGSSHWSASVEIDPASDAALFDVACRMHGRADWLGSRYRVSGRQAACESEKLRSRTRSHRRAWRERTVAGARTGDGRRRGALGAGGRRSSRRSGRRRIGNGPDRAVAISSLGSLGALTDCPPCTAGVESRCEPSAAGFWLPAVFFPLRQTLIRRGASFRMAVPCRWFFGLMWPSAARLAASGAMFEQIEKLRQDYTDKYVVVDATRPELARFSGSPARSRP